MSEIRCHNNYCAKVEELAAIKKHANKLGIALHSDGIVRPASVLEVLVAQDVKLEAESSRADRAEAECQEQARLNGMGAERELALRAKLEAAESSHVQAVKERDEAMKWGNCQHGISRQFKCADCHDPKAEVLSLKVNIENAESRLASARKRIAELEAELAARVAALESKLSAVEDREKRMREALAQNETARMCAESARELYERKCEVFREALTRIANPPGTVLLVADFAVETARAALSPEPK